MLAELLFRNRSTVSGAPTPLRNASTNEGMVGVRRRGLAFARVPAVVAQPAGHRNVASCASSFLSGDQVLGRSLKQPDSFPRQAVTLGKFFEIGQPSGCVAVDATTGLGKVGARSRGSHV